MKTPFLIFTMIGCAMLMHEASYADPAGSASAPPSSGVSASGQNNQASISQATTQVPNNQEPSAGKQIGNNPANTVSANLPANAVNPRQPGSSKSVVAANTVSPGNKTASSTACPPSIIQPAGPLLKDARNRGSATVAIGGPANSKNKIAAVISGASVNRKP